MPTYLYRLRKMRPRVIVEGESRKRDRSEITPELKIVVLTLQNEMVDDASTSTSSSVSDVAVDAIDAFGKALGKESFNAPPKASGAQDPKSVDLRLILIHHQLEKKRNRRLNHLLLTYDGRLDNIEALRSHLPAIYRPWAGDIEGLKVQLCSIHEILTRYSILKIEETNPCYGCRHELPGQDEHLECNTGCMHDPTYCPSCITFDSAESSTLGIDEPTTEGLATEGPAAGEPAADN